MMSVSRSPLRPVPVVAAAWLTFFVLWTLFILGWGQGTVSLGTAAMAGLTATVTAAALSVPVWHRTARYPWPERLTAAFPARHLGLALVFAGAWTVLGPVLGILLEGGNPADLTWDGPVYSWRLLMGVWLYVLVAGLSYAVRISRRLQDERLKAARAETLAAEARLAALRARLHPHFLFNALHTVAALVHTDRARAEEALERLGDLLRYAVRDREAPRVPLAEEWRFVEDYVALQALRFGDRVRCELHLDPALAAVPVPPFVLQPLVENAFRHALADRGGTLRVCAHGTPAALALVVEDDGPGCAPEPTRDGGGLATLRDRLAVLYPAGASLRIEPLDGGGTRATVHLPAPP